MIILRLVFGSSITIAYVLLNGCFAQEKVPSSLIQEIEHGLSSANDWPGQAPSKQLIGPPLFPKNFDWMSEEGICIRINSLCASDSEEVFDALITIGDSSDSHYALTLAFNSRPIGNFSTAKLARLIARVKLLEPIANSVELIESVRPGYLSRIESSIGIRELTAAPKGICVWRQNHRDLPPWQLQVLVGKYGIAYIQNDLQLDDAMKTKAIALIEKALEEINRNQRLLPSKSFFFRGFETYTAQQAKDIATKAIEQLR
jgi:hypothetical protein